MARPIKALLVFACVLVFTAGPIQCRPEFNPNSEYELISGGPQVVSVAATTPKTPPTTRRPVVVNTPPPVPADSKNFSYDPLTKTWTQLKKSAPPPQEDTLVWNQSNDKWLTHP